MPRWVVEKFARHFIETLKTAMTTTTPASTTDYGHGTPFLYAISNFVKFLRFAVGLDPIFRLKRLDQLHEYDLEDKCIDTAGVYLSDWVIKSPSWRLYK